MNVSFSSVEMFDGEAWQLGQGPMLKELYVRNLRVLLVSQCFSCQAFSALLTRIKLEWKILSRTNTPA
jgi:hypothetical protein